MSETKTEWYFIVNPRAGSGKTMSQWVPAEKLLEQKGIPFVTALTDHKDHATSLAREAAAAGYRRIAAVGGDGSLHEVFGGICSWCFENGVAPEEFRLAVVPIGSGNDWIKSCGVPSDVEEVIRLIAQESFGRMSRSGRTGRKSSPARPSPSPRATAPGPAAACARSPWHAMTTGSWTT